jgi:hypothetical protein
MLTLYVRSRPPTASAANWRTRWPPWRRRRLTSGASWRAAQAEARLARAEGNIAKELAGELQGRLTALESRAEGAEAAVRAEAERTRTQLMTAYRELGVRTGDFEVPE